MKKTISIIALIVALVLVCAGIGGVAFFTLGPVVSNNFNVDLVSASSDETKTVEIGKTVALQVEDGAGNVTVKGGDVEKITIDVRKTSYAETQSKAEQELKDIKYEIVQQGDTLIVRYKRPANGIRMTGNPDTVDFTITVPTEMKVSVVSDLGKVSLSDVKGDGNLKTNFGDISVQNLEGGLTVETESGGITAASITAGDSAIDLNSGFGAISLGKASAGDVKLDSQSGGLDVTNLRTSGDVALSTQFGNVTFENGSASALTVETQSGQVKLTSLNISSAVTVNGDFGGIELGKVNAKSYDLDTSSGSVTVNGAQGLVKVNAGFGPISITNAENVTLDLTTQSGSIEFEGSLGEGPHSLHSDFGEISLSLPADTAVDVDLQTEFGTITSDIPVTVVLSGETEKSHEVGTMNGGGPELKVSTQSGGITIKALKK
jgi:DUF4097 and DUF4098 domain-containing protein YvlB